MEKSSKPGKHRWTVAEIGLSVLLLLVSCALAGLVVLYTSAVREQSSRPNVASVSRGSSLEGQQDHSSFDNVCTTADCVTAAARLLQNMDDSVKPCDNFYQFACGGWLERHVIPETSSHHSVFDILRDKLEIVLKGTLETPNDQDRDAIRKAKVLYSSCMNESLIEQRDSQPLLKLIESIGDWPVASDDWSNTTGEFWSLEDTLATLTARFHKKVVLDMYVWTDDRDSQRHIIYIDQPGLGMPSRDYYFNDGNYKKAYLHFMASIAKITREDRNLTQDDERVWEEMVQVLELETDIANVSDSRNRRPQEKCMTTIFIQGVLSSVSLEVQSEEEVVVYSAPYLEKMNEVLSRHSNYLTWQLVIDRVNSLSRRFKDARARYRKNLYGTTVEDAWWRECVRYVQNSMENAVGALYVRETFAGESKRMVSDLIVKIQQAYVETLEELSWMDVTSKEKAREKPPFFSKHQHQVLNFGGIGMVIGHEITHGFDDNGRNFDKDGNMLNWWSNYSAEHFKDQSQCMVQQYGNFIWKLAGGQNVSGISTLGENIADNGGVRQAYKAYLKWVETAGEEPRLPGLDMDHKQLFFLNFAQVWCGAYRPEYASQTIKTDSHSPLEYRVLGSLQNFEAFSEAFQCPRGSTMNPEQKCRVW
uniref:Membrane metallo-endopeptidase-like 1 n=1 Tax=Neogobius melanostomus TaxID=47308 RepID=A0A8C6SUU6_9GOBI